MRWIPAHPARLQSLGVHRSPEHPRARVVLRFPKRRQRQVRTSTLWALLLIVKGRMMVKEQEDDR